MRETSKDLPEKVRLKVAARLEERLVGSIERMLRAVHAKQNAHINI